MSELAIPSAIDLLRAQLVGNPNPEDLALPLRALQLRGMTQTELMVHVERMRVANDSADQDETFEDNCLLALDIIHGQVPFGLTWDAAHRAAALLGRCLQESAIRDSLPFALHPSDLLPPRGPWNPEHERVHEHLARITWSGIEAATLLPSRSDFFRVPKSAFTTRPAALLALPDRLALEGLVTGLDGRLEERLPEGVHWPRRRLQGANHQASTQNVLQWSAPYIVKADINSYYESVGHAQLAVFLSRDAGLAVSVSRAIEAMLGAIMGADVGLPQGPPASDILASAYLLPLDLRLESEGTPFVRYADDFFFPARSMREGRALLLRLEELLRDIGLSLNAGKTLIMRRETYEQGLQRPSPSVVALKQRLIAEQLESLEEIDDAELLGSLLEDLGVEEQTLWDLLYHGTTTLEEVLPEIHDRLEPELASAYAAYVHHIARSLRSSERPTDLGPQEVLSRESLAFLSATTENIDAEDLRTLQKWFPGLAPLITRYVLSRSSHEWIGDFLEVQLGEEAPIDWVNAWYCEAAGHLSPSSSSLSQLLRQVISTEKPLSTLTAVWALASRGELTKSLWDEAFTGSSPALRSELFFGSLVEVDRYPWLSEALDALPESPQRSGTEHPGPPN